VTMVPFGTLQWMVTVLPKAEQIVSERLRHYKHSEVELYKTHGWYKDHIAESFGTLVLCIWPWVGT